MQAAHPRDGRPAVLRPGHPRRRRRHDRGRDRHQQAHALQLLSVQGRADRGLPVAPAPAGAVVRPAAGRADPRQFRAARALVRERRVPRLPVRQCGGRAQGARARRQPDRRRLQGAAALVVSRPARRLEVEDADALATQLQLLVDGAIAAALVRGDPKVAHAARDAARVLLAAAGVDVPGREPATRGARGRNRRSSAPSGR